MSLEDTSRQSPLPAQTGGGQPRGSASGYPSRRGFIAGLWASVPVWMAVVPFGMIFGTIAIEAGFDLVETMAYTIIVTAGASQLAALSVLEDGGPVLVAILTGAVVNLRMAMYSASLAVHWQGASMLWRVPAAFFLHDQAFAVSMTRYAKRDEPLSDRLGFYFGVGFSTTSVWILATLAGALIGEGLPDDLGLEFAVPACFLAITAPLIRGTANIAAAATAATLSILLLDLPHGLGLIIASAAGIAVGMATAARMEARR
ncbi:MAG: AzlC family ABC transporter permease [Pseudomonadota bacterium]